MIKKGFYSDRNYIKKFIHRYLAKRIKTSRYRNDKVASSLLKRENSLNIKVAKVFPGK